METNIARARKQGKENLVPKSTEELRLLNAAILRKIEEKDRLEREVWYIDRGTLYDLFNPAPIVSDTKPPQPHCC